MGRYDEADRPLGPGFDRTTKLLLTLAVAVIICGLAAAWATRAGAVTRPDYAGLGVAAPDVTVTELHPDGTARVELVIPDGAAPQNWNVATFHVPEPAQWHENQSPIDDQSPGLIGPGTYTFSLRTAPGACQIDAWLEGEEEAYSSDTSAEHGWVTCAPYPATLGPALPASEDVLSAAQAPPLATVDDTSGGGEQVTLSPTAPSLPPAAAQTAVLGVYAERALAATGRGPVGAVVGGLTFILGLLLVGTGWVIRKDGRL